MKSHDRVNCLEEGIFGLETVKLGANSKQQGVLLRNLGTFRRGIAAVALLILVLLGVAATSWSMAKRSAATVQRATREAALSDSRREVAECGAVVEGVFLKLDEADELFQRLRQRHLFDSFIGEERKLEKKLRSRVQDRLRQSWVGEEPQEKLDQLKAAFDLELEWFVTSMDDAVERVIGPLDVAFKDIPRKVRTLLVDVKRELARLQPKGRQDGGVCDDLLAAAAAVRLEKKVPARAAKLLTMLQRHLEKDPKHTEAVAARKLAGPWLKKQRDDASLAQIPMKVFAGLLTWYCSVSSADLRYLNDIPADPDHDAEADAEDERARHAGGAGGKAAATGKADGDGEKAADAGAGAEADAGGAEGGAEDAEAEDEADGEDEAEAGDEADDEDAGADDDDDGEGDNDDNEADGADAAEEDE